MSAAVADAEAKALAEAPGWDYIIVGAGTAGCGLASRLSADPSVRVLLLEAGGSDRRLWVRLPIGYARTFRDPALNWMLQTEPEPALAGRRSYSPRGRLIGGSGSINAMACVRGFAADFDGWAAAGNPGWDWASVLPLFMRSEDHARGAGPWHGVGGPMRVSDLRSAVHPLCASFLEAGQVLGLGLADDFNAPSAEGVGVYDIHTRGGWRESTARAYLRPAMARGNLKVLTHAQAESLCLQDGRAVGVRYRRGRSSRLARARSEVLLCAGAIHSPQLLQLSGIGPAGLLACHGIRCRVDLPQVGALLQDHLHITHVYRARVPTLNDQLHGWPARLRAAWRFALHRDGPLSMSVNQAGGFVRFGPGAPWRPNFQLYFNSASYSSLPEIGRRQMNTDPFPGFSMSVHACRPSSRGSVRIRSADAADAPAIRPNYLDTAHDCAEALAGARLSRALAAAEPLRALIAEELRPGPSADSGEALMADFRARADTIFHPVGTCGMGPDPARAVVDARLRVHGVGGLRVADASIFPAITSGNTNTPTLMVAEKAADLIREDARRAGP